METPPRRIQGNRVVLRCLQISDSVSITEHLQDREMFRWTIQIPFPYKQADAVRFIRQTQLSRRRKSMYAFGVLLGDSNEVSGILSLSNVSFKHGCAELGFWIGKQHWAKGYGTEAAQLALQFAFQNLGLHRVYASCFAPNIASRRVLEKSGFQQEGTMREAVLRDGKRHDFINYGILAREFSSCSQKRGA